MSLFISEEKEDYKLLETFFEQYNKTSLDI